MRGCGTANCFGKLPRPEVVPHPPLPASPPPLISASAFKSRRTSNTIFLPSSCRRPADPEWRSNVRAHPGATAPWLACTSEPASYLVERFSPCRTARRLSPVRNTCLASRRQRSCGVASTDGSSRPHHQLREPRVAQPAVSRRGRLHDPARGRTRAALDGAIDATRSSPGRQCARLGGDVDAGEW